MCCTIIRCYFFCKQKTAYEMRISDWSSDVCSSDLDQMHSISATSSSATPTMFHADPASCTLTVPLRAPIDDIVEAIGAHGSRIVEKHEQIIDRKSVV